MDRTTFGSYPANRSFTLRQRSAFIPFSYGPRSCVGRNVAEVCFIFHQSPETETTRNTQN
jgi:hypothetical protein